MVDDHSSKNIPPQYADTIYKPTSFNGYTDTPPSSQQSIQYLYRNEILTNLEELREELR